MKEARFEAVCPVEIGDKVILVDGSREHSTGKVICL